MSITALLESIFKWLFLLAVTVLALTYGYKDRLPPPDAFERGLLAAPEQSATDREPFSVRVRDQEYRVEPRFDYELNGVVVSYSDADALKNIWHHGSWSDFINLRDLCVIWGENVETGIYREMSFRSDSWTCWASWSERVVGSTFQVDALSNNHLLTDDPAIGSALMSAERGDQVRFRGVLAEYRNTGNGYFRGTSTTREDTGNGACETVYLDDFEIVRKANPRIRRLFDLAAWTAAISGIGFLILLPIAPVRVRRRI